MSAEPRPENQLKRSLPSDGQLYVKDLEPIADDEGISMDAIYVFIWIVTPILVLFIATTCYCRWQRRKRKARELEQRRLSYEAKVKRRNQEHIPTEIDLVEREMNIQDLQIYEENKVQDDKGLGELRKVDVSPMPSKRNINSVSDENELKVTPQPSSAAQRTTDKKNATMEGSSRL